jgi:phytoene dehydrogenase-like protein
MEKTVVVLGGGISGLVTSTLLGRAGIPVVLLERSPALGGRAATREKKGYRFNLGPHALYRRGILRHTLKQLGIDVHGGVPAPNGGFAMVEGRLHTLPVGLMSMLTTGALGVSGKLEFARLFARLTAIDPGPLQRQTLSSWLNASLTDRSAQRLFEMFVRVATFTNDSSHQSAGAAIEQLQLAVKGNVLYLDEGWQTIVGALRRAAADAGVRISTNAHATALEHRDARHVEAVRLANQSVIGASAVVIAATPHDVESLIGRPAFNTAMTPVRVATLDLALASLPNPKRNVAFGADAPVYYSVHSAVARLAPEGSALVHVARYLRPDESAGKETERELESVMDLLQPGWRNRIEVQQFVPNLVVAHAQASAAIGGTAGRPPVHVDGFDNVYIAGDWVGARGQLSDAAAASATDAADAVRRDAATDFAAA